MPDIFILTNAKIHDKRAKQYYWNVQKFKSPEFINTYSMWKKWGYNKFSLR